MDTKDLKGLKKRLEALYLPSEEDFSLVDVPDMRFVMIDGEGRPKGESHTRAIQWLFWAIHPLKVIGKERMGKYFIEPPLEGLWWADNTEDFINGNQDTFKWRMMIVTADWVTDELFEQAVAQTEDRRGKAPSSLRLDTYHEGTSVQIMHRGPFGKEVPVLSRLHKEFLPQNQLLPNGHHHEIYLNDPRRVAPEKRKTVLRQPVRSVARAQRA